MNDKYEPCSICEEYIKGVKCEKDKCPVAKMKAEVERLRIYHRENPLEMALICDELTEKLKTANAENERLLQKLQQAEVEVERLKIENAVIMKQSLAENKTTATAIMAETKQHIMTAEKIKRLEEDNERLKNHIQEGIDLAKQIPEMLALAKAEAYKEFDELLKDECLSYPLKENDITMLVDVERYNNLLNELVGDEK